jgi:hypothetical protein
MHDGAGREMSLEMCSGGGWAVKGVSVVARALPWAVCCSIGDAAFHRRAACT